MVQKKGRNPVILILSLIFLVLFFMTFVLMNMRVFQVVEFSIQSYFLEHQGGALTGISMVLSILFDPLSVIGMAFILSFVFYLSKMKRESFFLTSAILIGGALNFILKEIIQKARPENLVESGFSFPSGHATITVVLFCSIAYLSFDYVEKSTKYWISIFSAVIIILVSLSRLYLGVHWFSDVLGGFLLGAFVFVLNVYLFERR